MKVSDEILIQKILDGDKSSFGILVDRYKRSVFLQSIKTTRDFHDAQDITQDVFVEAYLNLQNLREPVKFGSWLRGITQNLCRRWMRKKQMLSDLEIPLDNLQTEVINQWLREQENAESWEFGTNVAAKLSDEQKALLKLFYLDNRSCREIAQQMGATEVAIRQRLSRTRQQLKTELLEGENMNNMIAISAICAFFWGGALSVSGGTWRDDFEDEDLAGWQEVWWEVPGNWTVESGQLVLDRSNHGDAPAYQTLADVVVDDVTMEFDAQMEQLFQNMNIVNIELTLRLQKPDFVFLPIGHWDNQWFAGGGLFWRGRIENWHQAPFPLKLGQWYRFRAIAQGDEFTLFIDDKKVLSFNEERLAKGQVGFGGIGSKVRFDNVVITGPGIPDRRGILIKGRGEIILRMVVLESSKR